jgi:hypothetical protein
MVVASPPVSPATARHVDLNLHVDASMTGKPQQLERAWAQATTRFELDAPAGAKLQVSLPDGVGMNGFAWANKGRDGISFAKQGADWVATTQVPVQQLSLNTFAHQHRGDAVAVADGDVIRVADLTPTLVVDGAAPSKEQPSVTVMAPLGWQTSAAGSASADVLDRIYRSEGVAAGDRSAGSGVATEARFTGRTHDGQRTTGLGRATREAGYRTGDAAATLGYLAMMIANAGRGRSRDEGDLTAEA